MRPRNAGNRVESVAVRFRPAVVLTVISPFSITMSRARLSPGSRHATLDSANRVSQIARRRASAPRNATHSSDTCTSSGVHTVTRLAVDDQHFELRQR